MRFFPSAQDIKNLFHYSYVFDIFAFSVTFIIGRILPEIELPLREWKTNDISISYSHHSNNTVAYSTVLAFIPVPLLILPLFYFINHKNFQPEHKNHRWLSIFHSWLGFFAAMCTTNAATTVIKWQGGLLRPDFLDRCQPITVNGILSCSGDSATIAEGRKTFPSGHSSTAWCIGMYTSLLIGMYFKTWIFERDIQWHISKNSSILYFHPKEAPKQSNQETFIEIISISQKRVLSYLLFSIPLFFAAFVSLSRVYDNKHKLRDVTVGALVGIFCTVTCYLMYFGRFWLYSECGGLRIRDISLIQNSCFNDFKTANSVENNGNISSNRLEGENLRSSQVNSSLIDPEIGLDVA